MLQNKLCIHFVVYMVYVRYKLHTVHMCCAYNSANRRFRARNVYVRCTPVLRVAKEKHLINKKEKLCKLKAMIACGLFSLFSPCLLIAFKYGFSPTMILFADLAQCKRWKLAIYILYVVVDIEPRHRGEIVATLHFYWNSKVINIIKN